MLLKVGIVMMAFALAFAAIAAGIAIGLRDGPEAALAANPSAEREIEPLPPSYSEEEMRALGVEAQPEPGSTPAPGTQQGAEARAEPEPQAGPGASSDPQAGSGAGADSAPEQPEQQTLPVARDDWPAPTEQELEAANQPRRYGLPSGAIMGLTVEAIGIYDAPVFDSADAWALTNGVAHEPQTSLPWSPTPQRNVYLAGHRMGYRGTWSRMIFYNLDKLKSGDEIVLEDRSGRVYRYRVSEVLEVEPTDVWVMGQVRGRDMVTLQTCTPIPTFEKRLIVRADRV